MMRSDAITVTTKLGSGDAQRRIAEAVGGRRSIARKYVRWVRRRNPKATPAEVIKAIGDHYVTAVTVASGVTQAATVAADWVATQLEDRPTPKDAANHGGKAALHEVAKFAVQKSDVIIPAADAQIQFEITAIFGLAIAEIHSMKLDKDQAQALVYGLSNGRVSQQQIATMAAHLAKLSSDAAGDGHQADASRNWSHWAGTLADSLPGGAAQSLLRTIQAGPLDAIPLNMHAKHRAAIDNGVQVVAGGLTRFVFGREVVDAAQVAFGAAPRAFPQHLAVREVAGKARKDAKPNRAFEALQDAARSTGNWVSDAASTVKSGVQDGAAAAGRGISAAADSVSRPFRSVDLDGDGVPDEPRALTAVKGVGNAITETADAAGDKATTLFKPKRKGVAAAAVPTLDVEVDADASVDAAASEPERVAVAAAPRQTSGGLAEAH